MQHLEAKATTTPTTDRGEFEALVATWDRDREGDVIVPGAFAKSITEWQSVGRLVPLHWNHKGDDIVGHVDPALMVETRDGLEVSGRVDLDTERGREVWRQIKANRVGFSFGFLATSSRKRSDGARELLEVDVYEVSVTPSPMNNRTRVLDTKSATTETRRYLDPRTGRLMNVAELRAHTKAMAKRTPPIRIARFEC
jgi:uncharacterized protein